VIGIKVYTLNKAQNFKNQKGVSEKHSVVGIAISTQQVISVASFIADTTVKFKFKKDLKSSNVA